MVSRLPIPVPLPKRHDFGINVTIFWRQRHDFGGNVINVDVNFDGRLRHSALMEFRAVST